MGDEAQVVAADLHERARTAQRDVQDRQRALQLAVELRNALIQEAYDEGYNERAIGRMFGLHRSTVTEILVRAAAQ